MNGKTHTLLFRKRDSTQETVINTLKHTMAALKMDANSSRGMVD